MRPGALVGLPPQIRRRVALNGLRQGAYHLAQSVEILANARRAGPVGRLLGAVAIGATLAEWLSEEVSPPQILVENGWRRIGASPVVAGALLELLRGAARSRSVRLLPRGRYDNPSLVELWDLDGQPVLASFRHQDEDWLLEREPGALARLTAGAPQAVGGMAALLDASAEAEGHAARLRLRSLGPLPPPPVGAALDALASWLRSESLAPEGRGRVALVVGPTGAGKTALCRTVLGSARLLQVPGRGVGLAAIYELCEALQPEVLLVDDLVLSDHGLDEAFAAMVDRLQPMVSLLLVTMMRDELTAEQADRPGGLYWPGMRAGRIDRVIYLPPPGPDDRRAILERLGVRGAALEALMAQTQGLTGAYLEEAVRRLGPEPPLARVGEVVRALRAQAPAAFSRHLDAAEGA